jgi:hypothetical protein
MCDIWSSHGGCCCLLTLCTPTSWTSSPKRRQPSTRLRGVASKMTKLTPSIGAGNRSYDKTRLRNPKVHYRAHKRLKLFSGSCSMTLCDLVVYPGSGGSTFLRNACNQLPDHTVTFMEWVQTGFGLIKEFIGLFYAQLVTTVYKSLLFLSLHYKSIMSSNSRSPKSVLPQKLPDQLLYLAKLNLLQLFVQS